MGPGRLDYLVHVHGRVSTREGTLRAILHRVAIGPHNLKARANGLGGGW